MGRGRQGTGVDALKTCIRVRFSYEGRRRVETLDLKPTPANIKASERLVATIRREIEFEVFDYLKHFPESAAVKSDETTFDHYADLYAATVTTAHSTAITYGTALRHWKRELGSKAVTAIKRSDVASAVATVAKGLNGKTVNSYVSVLRGVFEVAIGDGVLEDNPCDKVKSFKSQREPPDPLTQDEMELVLDRLARGPAEVHAFYEFAMTTGLRPSEQIALRWGKVDWVRKTAKVDTAHVRGQDKGTKTNTIREVDLNDRALAALQRMKPFTFMRGLDEHVFVDPMTQLPWISNEKLRVGHWHPALKACGLRLRDAYQTRHTFATVLLMAGMNVAYIAQQLGHASVVMTLKHYARWINEADKGAQARKANAVFGQQLVTEPTNPLRRKA